ncbi:MAG: Ig-like domain-containing protein [Eubacteriales bacterium]|nr:Ig-like domain-containing protein [Eubacteriales bacterium]
MFGNTYANKWLSQYLSGGTVKDLFNHIFRKENIKTAKDLQNLAQSQISTRKKLLETMNKYADLYKKRYPIKKEQVSDPVGNIPAISLNKKEATLYKNSSIQLKATIKNISGKVKWSSDNKGIAVVSSGGKVTGKSAGTVKIRATAGGITKTCVVTVKNPTIRLKQSKITVTLGSSKNTQLTAYVYGPSKKIRWKSSNTKIATVSSNGKISPRAKGSIKITATANGVSAVCTVNVKVSNAEYTNAKKAYNAFMKSQRMYGRYYAILNIGYKKAPVLLIADSSYFDFKWRTSKTYTPYDGYPIHLYTYVNGKVLGISGQIPQRMSAGAWCIYQNKLVAYMARGGYRLIEIYEQSYEAKYPMGAGSHEAVPDKVSKQWKTIKLTRCTY